MPTADQQVQSAQPNSKPFVWIQSEARQSSHATFHQPFRDPASANDSSTFPLDGQDLTSVSDEALIALYDTAPIIYEFGSTRVVRISRTLALKGGNSVLPCEAQNMSFAAAHTSIPVPKVHRTTCFIVMDYIQGVCLSECWDSLDIASRSDITSRVASMIQELESVSVQAPGPIGGTESRFRGMWFSVYGAGPFATIQKLEDWFNHKIDVCERFNQPIAGTPRFKFDRLVLTHQDITPCNFILGRDGQLWLVDWAASGGYPPGFERAAIALQLHHPDFGAEVCAKITDYPTVVMQRRAISFGLTTGALC
ncbi:phosphotransferase family protein [Hyaloscypha variabilis F]|uniref:Phosphotransferase family protein n=1 Tax=Hyaloscypha variabilis (strain UAMH 11265 / GT02V1 / F) TaxID=1149755 RepID=A0A2J6RNS1_HYAVF|nr:phosphotransferase family protein [Hyaloscypha variabilis F]